MAERPGFRAANQDDQPALAVASMTVAELARCAEVNPDTIRHYVRIGLLEPARNRHNGYKLFTTQI
ncbi:MAG: MerR family DNA-binding transcriptional regulator [Candidatus Competibacteraceae bacterium]